MDLVVKDDAGEVTKLSKSFDNSQAQSQSASFHREENRSVAR